MSRLIDLTDKNELTRTIRCPICDTDNPYQEHWVTCKMYLDGSYMIPPSIHMSTFAFCPKCGYIYNSAHGLHPEQEKDVREILQSQAYQMALQIQDETERRLALLLELHPDSLRYNVWMAHFYTQQNNPNARLRYLNKVIDLAKQRSHKTLLLKAYDFHAIRKLKYHPRSVCDADTDCMEMPYSYFIIDWLRQAQRFDEALYQIAKCKRQLTFSFQKGHIQYLHKEENLITQRNSKLL
ncbi:MAG: hypothetical protein IJZ68_07855 [Bacteroidaceae bacterium]|nr:hypothetical protein [Bacteroidaceae bacterium]